MNYSRRTVIAAGAACASGLVQAHTASPRPSHEIIDVRVSPLLPWKNGAGARRELAVHPTDASGDAFDWRIGTAAIVADAPFSVFPGIDRCIALIHGAGIRMSGEVQHELDVPLQPYCFPGEATIDSKLIAGASEALNVLMRRGVCAAKTSAVRRPVQLEANEMTTFAFCVTGNARVDVASGSIELQSGQAALWRSTSPRMAIHPATGETGTLLVQIRQVHDART